MDQFLDHPAHMNTLIQTDNKQVHHAETVNIVQSGFITANLITFCVTAASS